MSLSLPVPFRVGGCPLKHHVIGFFGVVVVAAYACGPVEPSPVGDRPGVGGVGGNGGGGAGGDSAWWESSALPVVGIEALASDWTAEPSSHITAIIDSEGVWSVEGPPFAPGWGRTFAVLVENRTSGVVTLESVLVDPPFFFIPGELATVATALPGDLLRIGFRHDPSETGLQRFAQVTTSAGSVDLLLTVGAQVEPALVCPATVVATTMAKVQQHACQNPTRVPFITDLVLTPSESFFVPSHGDSFFWPPASEGAPDVILYSRAEGAVLIEYREQHSGQVIAETEFEVDSEN